MAERPGPSGRSGQWTGRKLLVARIVLVTWLTLMMVLVLVAVVAVIR